MHTSSAGKTDENKNKTVSHTYGEPLQGTPSTFPLVDNRPEAIQFRKLQSLIKSYAPVLQSKIVKDKLNVVGENHKESDLDNRREQEKKIASSDAGGEYWEEYQFNTKGWFPSFGDDPDLRARQQLATLRDFAGYFVKDYATYSSAKSHTTEDHDKIYFDVSAIVDAARQAVIEERQSTDPKVIDALPHAKSLGEWMTMIQDSRVKDSPLVLSEKILRGIKDLQTNIIRYIGNKSTDEISTERSAHMGKIASGRKGKKFRGIWKVGDSHVRDIVADKKIPQSEYELSSRADFNKDYPDLPRLKE